MKSGRLGGHLDIWGGRDGAGAGPRPVESDLNVHLAAINPSERGQPFGQTAQNEVRGRWRYPQHLELLDWWVQVGGRETPSCTLVRVASHVPK